MASLDNNVLDKVEKELRQSAKLYRDKLVKILVNMDFDHPYITEVDEAWSMFRDGMGELGVFSLLKDEDFMEEYLKD